MYRLLLPALLLLAGCASAGRPAMKGPPGVDPAHLHFNEPTAAVGQPAPDFELPRADGRGTESLAAHRGRPVVLVFASYT